MKEFFGYISNDKVSSLFAYELRLRDQGCRPLVMGYDDKKFYAIYKAENKPKGLGRNREKFVGDIYIVPNHQRPEF
jgi:hypothetical protein